MRLLPANSTHLRAGGARLVAIVGVAVGLATATSSSRGDVFHLTSGGRIEGELLEQDDQHYKIRTVLGTVTLTADAVEHVEPAPSPLEEYERRREQTADTPADQVGLAKWCAARGLSRQQLAHLRRVLELDPDCEPVRRELGYVRVGGLWVDGRTVVAHGPATLAGAPPRGKGRPVDDPEKIAAAIQGNWRRRVSAIRHSLLDSSLDRQAQAGRERIRAIKDPLAIVPLTQVLSAGSSLCRELLVEVLARFPDDAATVNLAALALADQNEEIRRRAVAELARRKDSRVTAQFRKALQSDDDVLIRRAAEGLGALRAGEAVPELIQVLKARRRKVVEVLVPTYFGGLGKPFAPTVTYIGSTPVPVCPVVGLVNPSMSVNLQRRLMNVTVFRTEALEALRQITGVDFGFEQAAWMRWHEEHRS